LPDDFRRDGVISIYLFLIYRSSQRMTASRLKNASVAIEDLLKEYDIRLRPSFGSNKSFLVIEKKTFSL